jgi:NTP pyrophosphatase (non-canonical NTP hydrolase)
MTFDEYQKAAMATAVYPDEYRILYPALALAEEAGEVAGKVAKVLRDKGGEFSMADRHEIIRELGDVIWQTAALADGLGASLGDVAGCNLDKLASRQARGTLGGSGDDR